MQTVQIIRSCRLFLFSAHVNARQSVRLGVDSVLHTQVTYFRRRHGRSSCFFSLLDYLDYAAQLGITTEIIFVITMYARARSP